MLNYPELLFFLFQKRKKNRIQLSRSIFFKLKKEKLNKEEY